MLALLPVALAHSASPATDVATYLVRLRPDGGPAANPSGSGTSGADTVASPSGADTVADVAAGAIATLAVADAAADTVAADNVADTAPDAAASPAVPSPPTGAAISLRQRHLARVPVVRAQLAAAERRVARITPALKSLQADGAVTRFEAIPAAGVIVFQGTATAAAALAAEPAVAAVVANRELRLSDPAPARVGPASRPLGWNLVEVGADRAWHALGATR